MILIYQFFLGLALVLAGPFLLLKKKARQGLAEKFGFVPGQFKNEKLKGCLWIHAVSVGEFNAALPLIKKFAKAHSEIPLVISTTTATGQAMARDKTKDLATCFYFPFDLGFCFLPWLKALEPRCFVLIETEIWPAFITTLSKRGIPVISLNARISPRSFKRYRKLKFFFKQVFSAFTAVGAQSQNEVERFTAIGAAATRTTVIGNIKMDGLKPIPQASIDALKTKLNIDETDFVIVAGSTHEGEEAAILSAHQALSKLSDTRAVKTIIAPRHPERFARAASIIEEQGFSVIRHSRDQSFDNGNQIYLLDGLGQLTNYYALASVAFVGGTFAPVGGHNVAEPYTYGVPVCCGPGLSKTKDIAQILEDRGALLIAADPKELSKKLTELYLDEDKRLATGRLGAKWLSENQGAVDRALRLVQEILALKERYESAPK
ncbi:MAG: 3-deoxy-D-manno-octulosonic acid transferase [Candidatus Obscuribacterales bacterium]|nr:3-deoxy-D-manno-octulosonic acid transferase [Candidatus Obscuribacterales bacterium]